MEMLLTLLGMVVLAYIFAVEGKGDQETLDNVQTK